MEATLVFENDRVVKCPFAAQCDRIAELERQLAKRPTLGKAMAQLPRRIKPYGDWDEGYNAAITDCREKLKLALGNE